MTLLGLDFDNTLVCYDKLFHQIAVEKDLIKQSLPADKKTIRDYLRNHQKDEQFTLLQGEVYGKRILEAKPAEGMIEKLGELNRAGIKMVLVSHKTKKPYKGPAYDLHEAAWKWLEKYRFFKKTGLGWNKKQVYFEESKQKKIKRISQLECTHYVDDLEDVLEEIKGNVQKFWYTNEKTEAESGIIKFNNWRDLRL